MKRMLCSILACVLMCITMVGCTFGLARVSKRDVEKITGAEYSHVETDKENERRTYYFRGEYFDFTVSEYFSYNTYFPSYTVHTSYYEDLYRWKMPELKAVCEKYGYTLREDLASIWPSEACKQAKECGTYVVISDNSKITPDTWSTSYTHFIFYTVDEAQTDNINACAQEIILLLLKEAPYDPNEIFTKYYSVYQDTVYEENDKLTYSSEKLTDGPLHMWTIGQSE